MKKRVIKKLTTGLLSMLLCISLLPTFVSASEGLNQTSTSSETSEDVAPEEPNEVSTSEELEETATLEASSEIQQNKVKLGSTEYDTLEEAVKAAKSGDTIELGEGHYSLYGIDSTGSTKGKDLTFAGQGTGKTFWGIGAEVPDPNKFGTEYNGDYSFDGAGKIVFRNMTLQSGTADYLGFIRASHTVVEDSIINGKTFYWGYQSATFKNTVFNAPGEDYAIWTYSSSQMNFDGCTFNSNGKTINVYSEDKANKTINFSNCTVKSTSENRSVLNINDSNNKFVINISGKNVINGDVVKDTITGSRWFGYSKKDNNKGNTVVKIDGKTIFKDGEVLEVLNTTPTLEVKDIAITKGTDLELKDLVVSATDIEDGDLKYNVEIIDDGGFDKDKVGEYTILFKVTDKNGASITKKSVVKVIEEDDSKPGENPDEPGENPDEPGENPDEPGENPGQPGETSKDIEMIVKDIDGNGLLKEESLEFLKDRTLEFKDIYFRNTKTGKEVDVDKEMKVTVEVKYTNDLKVYHIEEDGSLTRVKHVSIDGNKVTFTFDRFSPFVFSTAKADGQTKPGSSQTVPNTSTPAPKTGYSINMIFYVALLGLSGALLTVMRLKRRKEN